MTEKKHTQDKTPSATDKLALFIGTSIAKLLQHSVARLSAWESRCSSRQKKLYLLLFCLLMGGYFLYILITVTALPASVKNSFPRPEKPVPQLGLPPPAGSDTIHSTKKF